MTIGPAFGRPVVYPTGIRTSRQYGEASSLCPAASQPARDCQKFPIRIGTYSR